MFSLRLSLRRGNRSRAAGQGTGYPAKLDINGSIMTGSHKGVGGEMSRAAYKPPDDPASRTATERSGGACGTALFHIYHMTVDRV
jgi:hypothetical protein